LKEREKGREDEEVYLSSYLMSIKKEKILEFERGSTRLHTGELAME
jgi:hypothetical protein